jgi:uncharacterized protein (TIGR02594 family)
MIEQPEWLLNARDMIGLKEIPGHIHEPLVVRLWEMAGMPHIQDDETAWCAAFVGGCLELAGIKSTRKPNARSYTDWGVDVLESGPLEIPLGAIVVFSRPPSEWQGHVAFAVGYNDADQLLCLGGNQKNMVRVDPFHVKRIVAARWPSEHRTDLRMLRRLPKLPINTPLSTGEA